MERMGPEALLVASARTRSTSVAEFARLEYSRAEAPRIEGLLLWEMEGLRERRTVEGRLRKWGRALFRSPTPGSAREEPMRSPISAIPAGAAPQRGIPSAPNLVTLPASIAAARPARDVFPLVAASIRGRV
ncbi:MAG: hypothetical protein L3K14_04735 [Thermoplasmata archaeon]|nr:hypothetical protein [Thermoplasmata archaeon]